MQNNGHAKGTAQLDDCGRGRHLLTRLSTDSSETGAIKTHRKKNASKCYFSLKGHIGVDIKGLAAHSVPASVAGSAPKTAVRLAVCQILVIDSDREGNFRRIEYALEQAESQHADIALLPESSILGWENPEAHSMAQPIPGQDSERIAELARKHNLMIAIGLDEKEDDRLFDSSILVDRSGKMLWKHRKINVLPELMTPPYAQGRPKDIGTVDTEFGRIAVLICADTFTDAHLKRLKALKPELMLVPYGWAAPKEEWPGHSKELEDLVKRRAAELRCPIAGVNLVGQMSHGPWQGQTYGGSSFVADASGKLLLTLRDRDTDLRVIDLVVGSQAK
jgi:predicted amidohydrolase